MARDDGLDGPPLGATGYEGRFDAFIPGCCQGLAPNQSDNASGSPVCGRRVNPAGVTPISARMASLLNGMSDRSRPIDEMATLEASRRAFAVTERQRFRRHSQPYRTEKTA